MQAAELWWKADLRRFIAGSTGRSRI